MNSIELIIPAYNEEHRIEPTIRSYADYFKNSIKLHVVMNGCTDNTLEVLERLQQEHDITITNIAEPIGKGGAVLAGWKASTAEYVGFVDADGSTGPDEFNRLVSNVAEHDAVIASRFLKDSTVHDRQSPFRNTMSRVFIMATKLLFRMPYTDTQCGAKLFKRTTLEPVLSEVTHTDMSFDVELLWRLHQHGVIAHEVPTVWLDKPGSASLGSATHFIKVGIGMLSKLIRLRFSR